MKDLDVVEKRVKNVTAMRSSKDAVSVIVATRNERENIVALMKSIYEQAYRPIEVVAVDAGSSDGTFEMLSDLSGDLEGDDFRLKVLREEDFGATRSPANARNIGVLNSSGEYVIFVDADMALCDKDFVERVRIALDMYPWVGVQAKPTNDSALETALFAQVLTWSGSYVHEYCGLRRSLFKTRLFDPRLGYGEDRDFFVDFLKKELGIMPHFVDAFILRHEPHTLKEFVKQQIWYARTCLLYGRKHYSYRQNIRMLVAPVKAAALLVLMVVTPVLGVIWSWNSALVLAWTTLFAALFAHARIRFWLKMPVEYRHPKLFLLVTVVGCLLRPLAWCYGIILGLSNHKR